MTYSPFERKMLWIGVLALLGYFLYGFVVAYGTNGLSAYRSGISPG